VAESHDDRSFGKRFKFNPKRGNDGYRCAPPILRILKRLVLVGGGHSHLFVLEAFGKQPMTGVEITLVNRGRHAPYSGMLPGLIAGHYSFLDCHIDLKRLCRFAKVRFVDDEVSSIDLQRNLVQLRGGMHPIAYDLASIDTGSTPPLDTPGAKAAVVPIKPIENFLHAWVALQSRMLEVKRALRIALVGGGAASVEVGLAMHHKLHQLAPQHPPIFEIVTDEASILTTHNAFVRHHFQRLLERRGFAVRAISRVASIDNGALNFRDGRRASSDFVV
jgi:selenide, water dikinase